MGSRFRLVTFDATNTLLKFKEPVGQAYSGVASLYGVTSDPKKLTSSFKREWKHMLAQHPNFGCYDGLTSQDWWSELVRRTFLHSGCASVSDGKMTLIATHLFESYKTSHCWAVDKGAESILKKLKLTGHKVGMISNTDERLDAVLRNVGLRQYFDFVIASAVARVEKPSKEVFSLALSHASQGDDIKPYEALHVGDDVELDYCASRRAGWNGALLLRDFSRQEQRVVKENVHPSDIIFQLVDIEKRVFLEPSVTFIAAPLCKV